MSRPTARKMRGDRTARWIAVVLPHDGAADRLAVGGLHIELLVVEDLKWAVVAVGRRDKRCAVPRHAQTEIAGVAHELAVGRRKRELVLRARDVAWDRRAGVRTIGVGDEPRPDEWHVGAAA